MKNYPKISIITPSYNQGQFIEDAILSVKNQNYPNYEHIIIDGGSTDGTIGILKKYPHLKWVSEPDEGQSDALNKGFLKANSDWILWLNADDFLLNGAFNSFITNINKFPGCNVFYGHTQFVNESATKLYTCYHIPYKYNYTFFGVYCFPSTGTLYKASLLKSNLLNINFHIVMDTEWALRCGKEVNAKLINRELVSFRISSTNKTSENIQFGKVTLQHQRERNLNKLLYINSKRKYLNKTLFNVYLICGKFLFKYIMYLNKLRSLIISKIK